MIRNIDSESLAFGDEDKFYQRLDEFNRHCLARIRMIPWISRSIPGNCWSFLKYLGSSITGFFLRKYIVVIVVVLSASILLAAIVVLRGHERIITSLYCLSFIACSVLCLLCKRGRVAFARESRFQLLEHHQLSVEFNHRNKQKADNTAGYGEKDKQQPLQRALVNSMEPRLESEADPAIDFHGSGTPFNYSDENSAGPSHAPECTDTFTITNINDDSYDSDEPFERRSEARISAEAVKTFGHPVQVLGADSYRVLLNSSDEYCSSEERVAAEVKIFEAPVTVHNSDSHTPRPWNSSNDGSNSAELASVANDQSTLMLGSDSHSNLPYVDDD